MSRRLRVGMKVRVRLGGRMVSGTVVEDRGPIAPAGVQLVRIRVQLGGVDETVDFEVPASSVEGVAAA